MNDELGYYKKLASTMYVTRGARFNAAEMLSLKNRVSVVTVAALAIFLLSSSVCLLVMQDYIDEMTVAVFGALSTTASAALLVLSLTDYAFDRSVLAEKLHRNALRITLIMRALERELCRPDLDFDRMRQLADEYEREILDTHVNHSSADHKRFSLYRACADTQWKCKSKIWEYRSFNVWCVFIGLIGQILILFLIASVTICYIVYRIW